MKGYISTHRRPLRARGGASFRPQAGIPASISTLTPNTAIANSGDFTLTVTGTNFAAGAVVQWNGLPRPTTYVTSTQLTAEISNDDIFFADFDSVTVVNPGTAASNALTFTVTSTPIIDSISPSSVTQDSGDFVLTVNGSNFVSGSLVNINGAHRATIYVSDTQLTATILNSDLSSPGVDQVTVTNPGGIDSNEVDLTVLSSAPVILSLSPNTRTAGAAGFTLTVNGSNFVSGAVVKWNGSARTTTFVSSTQLTATINAADVTTAATDLVTVTNPSGVTSSSAGFVVTEAGTGTLSTSLQITSNLTNANTPWTFGQPIKQGDVPPGNYITATGGASAFQANVVNTWPDGSAKYVIISGISNCAAATPLTVTLASTNTAPSGSNISEAALKSLIGATGNAYFTASGIGTVDLYSLIGTTATVSNDATTGLLRSFLGPVMSEFHYRGKAGSNAHLRVYFYVRLYSTGDCEIQARIENGFTNVLNPQMQTYVPTLFIGAAGTVWSNGGATFSHYHHTHVEGTTSAFMPWFGPNQFQVVPLHDLAYCKASRLVANYGVATLSSSYKAGLTTAYSPYILGDYSANWGATGYQPAIGILPDWEAGYWTNGDAATWKASVVNAFIAAGFYHHYRDETTGRPVLPRSYPTYCFGNNAGFQAGGKVGNPSLPASDANFPSYPAAWNEQHHPQLAVTAYITTGRWSFMEELQFEAGAIGIDAYSISGRVNYNGSPIFDSQNATATRGCAWALRDTAYAANFTQDSDSTQQQQWYQILSDNLAYYAAAYVFQNNLGVILEYATANGAYGNEDGYSNQISCGMFQQFFMCSALGLIADMQLNLSNAAHLSLTAMIGHMDQIYTGLMGLNQGISSGFQDAAAIYNMLLSPNAYSSMTKAAFNAGCYSDWKTAFAASLAVYQTLSGHDVTVGTTFAIGGALRGSSGSNPAGVGTYWDNLLPGLAMFADFGFQGSIRGYQYLTTASNWSSVVSAFNDHPGWYILSRLVGQLPAFATGAAINQWVSGLSISAGGVIPSPVPYKGGTSYRYITDDWSGAALKFGGSQLMHQGGGHADYSGNEVIAFDPFTNSWKIKFGPTPNQYIGGSGTGPTGLGFFYYGDNNPSATHTYYGLQHIPHRARLFRMFSGAYSGPGAGPSAGGSEGLTSISHVDALQDGAANWDAIGSWPDNAPLDDYDGVGYAYGHCQDFNGNVYALYGQLNFYRWSVKDGSWTRLGGTPSGGAGAIYSSLCYDSIRHRLYMLGTSNPAGGSVLASGQMTIFDLNTNTSSKVTMTGAAATAMYAAANCQGAGVWHDPLKDLIYVYNGDQNLYTIDPDTYAAVQVTTTGTPPPNLTSDSSLYPLGKCQYAPQIGALLYQPQYTSDLKLIRTH